MISGLAPWEFSPALVAVIGITALLYTRGLRACPVSFPRALAFWSGLGLIYAVSHTQFDYYSQHQFFIHRIQHIALHHAGPFLIVLSRPRAILAAGTPEHILAMAWRVCRSKAVAWIGDIFLHPLVQIFLFAGLIVFWLVPDVHVMAMLDWRYYRLMNWSMAITGLSFWGVALSPPRSWAARYGLGWRIGMMLAVIPVQIIAGALLFVTPIELYPVYSICGRAFTGIGPRADQQLGGLILWIPAAMMSVLGIVLVARRAFFAFA